MTMHDGAGGSADAACAVALCRRSSSSLFNSRVRRSAFDLDGFDDGAVGFGESAREEDGPREAPDKEGAEASDVVANVGVRRPKQVKSRFTARGSISRRQATALQCLSLESLPSFDAEPSKPECSETASC